MVLSMISESIAKGSSIKSCLFHFTSHHKAHDVRFLENREFIWHFLRAFRSDLATLESLVKKSHTPRPIPRPPTVIPLSLTGYSLLPLIKN